MGLCQGGPGPTRPRTRAPSAAWSRWAPCVSLRRGLGSAPPPFALPRWAPWTHLSCGESAAGSKPGSWGRQGAPREASHTRVPAPSPRLAGGRCIQSQSPGLYLSPRSCQLCDPGHLICSPMPVPSPVKCGKYSLYSPRCYEHQLRQRIYSTEESTWHRLVLKSSMCVYTVNRYMHTYVYM